MGYNIWVGSKMGTVREGVPASHCRDPGYWRHIPVSPFTPICPSVAAASAQVYLLESESVPYLGPNVRPYHILYHILHPYTHL